VPTRLTGSAWLMSGWLHRQTRLHTVRQLRSLGPGRGQKIPALWSSAGVHINWCAYQGVRGAGRWLDWGVLGEGGWLDGGGEWDSWLRLAASDC
jgi:hypothetical protein